MKDLDTKARAFIDGWNDRSHPLSGPRSQNKSSPKPTAQRLQPEPLGPSQRPDKARRRRQIRIVDSGSGVRKKVSLARRASAAVGCVDIMIDIPLLTRAFSFSHRCTRSVDQGRCRLAYSSRCRSLGGSGTLAP